MPGASTSGEEVCRLPLPMSAFEVQGSRNLSLSNTL